MRLGQLECLELSVHGVLLSVRRLFRARKDERVIRQAPVCLASSADAHIERRLLQVHAHSILQPQRTQGLSVAAAGEP